jgi:uncharacterized DUF497 family protein
MGLLQRLGMGQQFLRMGLFGPNGSGKTFTAALVAIGLKKRLGLTGPIAMFDTEGGSEFIAPMVRKETGGDFVGYKGQSFDDLIALTKECVAEHVPIMLTDSATHVWLETCKAALKKQNDALIRSNKQPKSRLDMQDYGPIKEFWATWTSLYLNAPMHMIVCGRAGAIWDQEWNEEKNKNELVKTGTKMKTEGEFGYEPSLLVEMDRVQKEERKKGQTRKRAHLHQAVVVKDRFNVIDGSVALDPDFEFFLPHIKLLTPDSHTPIDTTIKSDLPIGVDGNPEWHNERRQRTILSEEIQGILVEAYPGQGAKEKQAKARLLANAFGTHSWTKISESLPSTQLRLGLEHIKAALAVAEQPAPDPEAEKVEVPA